MQQSPYAQHRSILVDDSYGTACRLQEFVLHQQDGDQYPFDIDQHWGGFDTRHRQIYTELREWVWQHGLDSTFEEVVRIIIAKRQEEAQANFDELTWLRHMSPEDFQPESGETPVESHRRAIATCEMWQKRYAEKGFVACADMS